MANISSAHGTINFKTKTLETLSNIVLLMRKEENLTDYATVLGEAHLEDNGTLTFDFSGSGHWAYQNNIEGLFENFKGLITENTIMRQILEKVLDEPFTMEFDYIDHHATDWMVHVKARLTNDPSRYVSAHNPSIEMPIITRLKNTISFEMLSKEELDMTAENLRKYANEACLDTRVGDIEKLINWLLEDEQLTHLEPIAKRGVDFDLLKNDLKLDLERKVQGLPQFISNYIGNNAEWGHQIYMTDDFIDSETELYQLIQSAYLKFLKKRNEEASANKSEEFDKATIRKLLNKFEELDKLIEFTIVAAKITNITNLHFAKERTIDVNAVRERAIGANMIKDIVISTLKNILSDDEI